MHVNTEQTYQLLFHHLLVGPNSYRHRAFIYVAPTVWNKLLFCIRNASSVTLLRTKLKTHYFKTPSRPPNGCVKSGFEV